MTQKKVINGDDTLNLTPIKYPYAYDAFKAACRSIWFPGEVAVGEDIQSYKEELTEAERHLFLHVFAQLSTMDIAAGGIIIDILQRITSPEHQMALAAQNFQEGIHTDSYQYAVEHLGIDPDWLWDRWKDVPTIKAKIDYASEVFNDPSYTFLAKYFFFSAVFEGVWFMTGFTPIFSLANRKKMIRSAELLQYIAKDENHHTMFGLRTIQDIAGEDASFDPDRFLVEVTQITNHALVLEHNYAEFLFSKGDIKGYSVATHDALAAYKAIENFKYIGLDAGGLNPLQSPAEPYWLDSQINLSKMKNFFETRVTEYQVGSDLAFDGEGDDWLDLNNNEGSLCSLDDIANGSCESCQ